jgi:APA family basic amino acid/polyamine antiporter
MAETDEPVKAPHTGLKRSLSLSMAVFYGVGNILGAGIYVLIGKVAGVAGYYAPLAFLFSALILVPTAFTYAEWVSRSPRSAGEAVYVNEAFGSRFLSTVVGLLILVAGIVSSSALVRGFLGYLKVLMPTNEQFAIVLLVIVLGVIAIWGIKQSVRIVSLITILEILGLLVVIGAGMKQSVSSPIVPPGAPPLSWVGVWFGAFLAFYAFLGFEDMVNIAEEVNSPRQNLPRAIVIALIVTTLLYTTVAIVVQRVFTPAELYASEAPMSAIVARATGGSGAAIAVISMLAVLNGALVQMIMSSRVLFGMGRRAWLPNFFSQVWPVTRTPVPATFVTMIGVILFASLLPIQSLAAITSFLVLIVFALINLSLIKVKLRAEQKTIPFQTPIWVPIIGTLTTLALATFSLVQYLN